MSQAGSEVGGRQESCGHPTKAGGLCSRSPMAGSEHCHQHAGLGTTQAEQEASARNPVEHGYYFSGFVDEDERELFKAIADGDVDLGELQRQIVGALTVRAMRVLEWEAQGRDVSGLVTSAFAELRKAMDAMDPDAFRIEHSFDYQEIRETVDELFAEETRLVLKYVPDEVREDVREAMD